MIKKKKSQVIFFRHVQNYDNFKNGISVRTSKSKSKFKQQGLKSKLTLI